MGHDSFPQFKQWVARVVKAELTHLDDTISVIKLHFPIFTWNSDPCELANIYITGWINHLCKHHLKIKTFQVHLGSVNVNGEEHYSTYYFPQDIPLNRVFVPTYPKGKWVKPEVVARREEKKRLKRMEKNMNAGLNPLSGKANKRSPDPQSWQN